MGNLVSITGKLEKLIPRLGTDADGEVIAIVRAIERALKSNGNDWHDLAAALKAQPEPIQYQPYTAPKPQPQPRYQARDQELEQFLQMARYLRDFCAARLNEKCRRFVVEMANTLGAGQAISTKQKQFLANLYAQNGGAM